MNRLSSLLGGLAVIAIAIVFVVNFQPGGGQNQLKAGPECAADVLGNCVKVSHYWASFNLMKWNADTGANDRWQLRQKAMDGLVERELLLAEAKRLGISVSDEEVTKELSAGRVRFSIPASMPTDYFIYLGGQGGVRNMRNDFLDKKTKKFSIESYKKAIGSITRLSEEEFRDYQKAEIIASRVRELVMARVRVSDAEARDEFLAEKSTAKVRYVKLNPGFYADRAVDRSEKAIKTWADAHADAIGKAFETRKASLGQGCREVRQIAIEVKKGAPEDVKNKAKARLEAARKRILAGESFESFVEPLSEDPSSRLEGGRVGCLPRGEMSGGEMPLEVALYGIKEPGGLSEVVETGRGVYLLKFEKELTGADAEKALRDRIVHEQYVIAEAQRLAEAAAQEIRDAVKTGTSMEDALKTHIAKYPTRKALPPAPLPSPLLNPSEGGDTKPEDGKPADPKKEEPKGDNKGEPKKDQPKKDEPKKAEPKKEEPKPAEPKPAEPKPAEPKKDEPKKEEPEAEEPKKEEPKEDPLAGPVIDPLLPTIETSLTFTATEDALEDAVDGASASAAAFALKNPNDVADKLINLRTGGFAVMQLVEKKVPDDAEWKKNRDEYMQKRRVKKQQEALIQYLKQLRTKHTQEIKMNPEASVLPSAKGADSSAPPPEDY